MGEHRARLLTLDLLPHADAVDRPCPLCGSEQTHDAPTANELRASSSASEPRRPRRSPSSLSCTRWSRSSIKRIQEHLGRLHETDRELEVLFARNELARRARGRLEQQAYLRGRIGGFLEEHPAVDANPRTGLQNPANLAEARVRALEEALSADTTRRQTENALSYVGKDMTEMAQRLHLS